MVGATSLGSDMGASATKYTPSRYASRNMAATSIATRVLPVPPGPISVNRRGTADVGRSICRMLARTS